MEIKKTKITPSGIKFVITSEGKAIARAFLYILTNDQHQQPFGFMEDVFVHEDFRRKGYGAEIVTAVIKEAKQQGCYKLICTSRSARQEIHEFYKKFGFTEHGLEFRMNFN
ncbi:MAG: GNAT family N-acetyltransferase [Nanoarchaeota archaeon]